MLVSGQVSLLVTSICVALLRSTTSAVQVSLPVKQLIECPLNKPQNKTLRNIKLGDIKLGFMQGATL